MSKENKAPKLTPGDIDRFDKLKTQIAQLLKDISELSKKHPDGPISKFKLKFVNEKIINANYFLQGIFLPIEDFVAFDDSTLPTNSDVVMVLSQYLECLEFWRSANVRHRKNEYGSYYWEWAVDSISIATDEPTKHLTSRK